MYTCSEKFEGIAQDFYILDKCKHPFGGLQLAKLNNVFVFKIYIVWGFEEEDSLANVRILSCFV